MSDDLFSIIARIFGVALLISLGLRAIFHRNEQATVLDVVQVAVLLGMMILTTD